MNASKCLITGGILAAVVIICLAGERPAANEQNDAQAVVEGNSRFALELYARLRGSEGNLFFSPYSISAALGVAAIIIHYIDQTVVEGLVLLAAVALIAGILLRLGYVVSMWNSHSVVWLRRRLRFARPVHGPPGA